MVRIIRLLLFVAATVSCAAPKLTNNDRGNYAYRTLENPNEVLGVKVSVLPLPDPPAKVTEKPKSFFELRDSIPNTFLRVIGNKAATTSEVLEAIKAPLSVVEAEKATPVKEINDHEIKIRFLFSNIKRYFNNPELLHPNTRLEFLNTTLRITSPYFYIHTIDRLENEFEQIDMGTLERTKNVSFESKLTGEAGANVNVAQESTASNAETGESKSGQENKVYDAAGNVIGIMGLSQGGSTGNTVKTTGSTSASKALGAKAELQYANTEMIKEALHVKYNKLKTGFSFSPNDLTLSQRGAILTDISDNVFITATLRLDRKKVTSANVVEFKDLMGKNGEPLPLDKVSMTGRRVNFVPCNDSIPDLRLEVDYEGAIRAVKNQVRGRNSLEFDDKVIYHTFQKQNTTGVVMQKEAICHSIYRLEVTFKGDSQPYVLNRNIADPSEVLLYSKHNPSSLEEWVMRAIQEGNTGNFQRSGDELFFVRRDGEKVIYLSKKDFQAKDLNLLRTLRTIGLREVK